MYNTQKHNRRSIRLKEYDYSKPGVYFITICTKNRKCFFGEIINGKLTLNDFGEIAKKCWLEIPSHYPNVTLDEFVIMPNHVHGILIINDINVRIQNIESLHQNIESLHQNIESLHQNIESLHQQNKFQKIIPRSIGSIIRGFKIGVTKWFRQNTKNKIVWQRNYYEHIIRNEFELNKIRYYIINNPSNWQLDLNYNKSMKC